MVSCFSFSFFSCQNLCFFTYFFQNWKVKLGSERNTVVVFISHYLSNIKREILAAKKIVRETFVPAGLLRNLVRMRKILGVKKNPFFITTFLFLNT